MSLVCSKDNYVYLATLCVGYCKALDLKRYVLKTSVSFSSHFGWRATDQQSNEKAVE